MKKGLKIIYIIIGIIFVLGVTFLGVDYNRVKKQEKPIFCIKNSAEDWNKENKIIKYQYQKEGQFCIAPIGMTYIKINDKIISPYSELYITDDKIRENAKEIMNIK